MTGIIFLIFLITCVAYLWLGHIQNQKVNRLVYVTNLQKSGILEAMSHHNVKDLIGFDFFFDEQLQQYIFRAKEIRKDMYACVKSIEYIFYTQSTDNKVFITLEKRWQSSLDENITYGSVMDKFMWEKLQASPVKD